MTLAYPDTLRDSILVLERLLRTNPTEIMTNMAGSSDPIFGLLWLPGYQFSLRLTDAGATVFWRVDKYVDYGVLKDITRHAMARASGHGPRAEIGKRYCEWQEERLGSAELVTNAGVLWNTLYMQEAVSWMRSNDEEIGDENIARLSPLMQRYIRPRWRRIF